MATPANQGWKVVQCYGNSETRVDNDHWGDYLIVDDATKRYYESIIPQPSGSDVYSYEIVYQIELTRKQRTAISSVVFYTDDAYPDAPTNLVKVYAKYVLRTAYATPDHLNPTTHGYTLAHTSYYDSTHVLELANVGGGNSITLQNVGDKSHFLYLQLLVANGALKRQRLYFPMHFYPVRTYP